MALKFLFRLQKSDAVEMNGSLGTDLVAFIRVGVFPASWYSLTTSQPRRSAICFLYAQKRQPQLPAPRIVENGPALE